MLVSLNRKSLFTLYLSLLRPCIIMASQNTRNLCSTPCSDTPRPTETQTQTTTFDKGVSGSIHAGK